MLCHLLLSERDFNQTWAATLVSGNEMRNFPTNLPARIAAVLRAYPTLEALRKELRIGQKIVVEFVANLPDEFVENTATYVHLGQGLLQGQLHPQSHYAQITAAIESARK